jgi:hypothetical protein
MKKTFNKSSIKLIACAFLSTITAQDPFLEIHPYAPPSFEQYPAKHHVDHHYPSSNITDDTFLRFDGVEFTGDVIYPDCLSGTSCYDGHAGTDYYMPLNTPILAPAGGYVLWASFSAPADPCPGGISPNGDQGTIIIAHGNDYYSCYLHMNPPLAVAVGETVETGDTLGFAGNSGCAINTHLHFEIRKDNWFFNSEEPWAVDPFGWWGEENDPIETIRSNKSEWLWISSDLVDDGDNGFQRYSGPDWTYLSSGFNNDSWIAPAISGLSNSRHYAIWVPHLEDSGQYDVEVFTPAGANASTGAIYEINVKNENGTSTRSEIVVDQNSDTDSFKTIATMDLPSGSMCSVILRDIVSDSSFGSYVIFDAIRFTSSTTTKVLDEKNYNNPPEHLTVLQVTPNPFNPNTIIHYQILEQSNVTIYVFNIKGNQIYFNLNKDQAPGLHSYQWKALNSRGEPVPTGVYFITVESKGFLSTKKVLLIK